MSCCEDCKKQEYRVVRYKTASLAIQRPSIFFGPITERNKTILLDFKAKAQRQGGRNRIQYKAGITGSDSRYLQGVQGVVSSVLPGNASTLRSPVRSRIFSAFSPGGPPNVPFVGKPGDTTRGYRCPEGYQYGGRFTDSALSTCGQKLFQIAANLLGQLVGDLVSTARQPKRNVSAQSIGTPVTFDETGGQLVTSRAAQIPKASADNPKAYAQSVEKIIGEMSSTEGSFKRLVRRDGFTLEPVVSSAVLRTVPDNRDMEGANYIVSILKASEIGIPDDIGLLSNTGVRKLTYVLPGGSTLSVEKSRILTVGERRKLGRTIKTLDSIDTQSDPAAKLKALAVEMGSGIAYKEDFKIENANDIVDAVLPGTNRTRQVRRWYYESLLRSPSGKKKNSAEKNSRETNAEVLNEKITNLDYAIKHININGSISDVSPSIRAEAIKRSKMYKSRKLRNGLNVYDKPDGQSLIEIPPSKNDYEHIGAAVSSDIQSYLELATPKMFVSGQGRRRPYFIQESNDVIDKGKIDQNTTSDTFNMDDLLRITVSDYIVDTRDRDISTITQVQSSGVSRTLASINRNSGLSGLSRSAEELRNQLKAEDFYSQEYLNLIKSNFEKRSAAQRQNAIRLFDAMLSRLKEYNVSEMTQRLSLDGEYSQAEKTHIKLVESLIKARIDMLSKSREAFIKIIGLKS